MSSDEAAAPPGATRSAAFQARLERLVARPVFWVAFLAVALGWPIARALLVRLPPPLPVIATVPSFEMTDQRGRPFRTEDLRGRTWVAGFMFTRCPSVCPALTQRMLEIQRRGRNLGDAFHLVSFSVDPEHDTPELLERYALEHGCRQHGWTFLTGAGDDLERVVVKGFKIALERKGSDEDPSNLLHGTHLVLVDSRLQVRGYYDSSEPESVDRLLRDAGMLANRGN